MADVAELKHMVTSFRVSELQVLLGFAGRNKSGRKQELMARSLQLIEKGCSTAIHIKIKDLYRRRFPANKPGMNPAMKSPPGVSPSAASSSTMSPNKRGYGSYGGTVPFGGGGGGGGALDFSSKHSSGMGSPSASPLSQVPIHPDVCFKRLPFYDMLGELLKPSSLVPRGQSRFQENFFVFHLTPQQAQDIAMSRDTHISGRVDYTVQIQLRFCLLETSCEQEDNFPPSICVRVNGKMAPLPNPIPTNKPGVEPKRPSRPVNITTICRISPTVPNHINISWASELGRSYCVSVYLVRRLTSDLLLQRLKQSGTRHPDHTRALIKEKLAHDPDSEIVTSSLRVSLLCPLGKMRMSIPARASSCTHLQCFDGPMYLQMNEKKPTWTCPVCDKAAEFGKLFIDGLFTEILRSELDCSEIKCTEDGQWHTIKEQNDEKEIDCAIVQSIEDSPNPKKEPTDSGEMIDLTETDDEDDATVEMMVADSSSSVGSPESHVSTSSSEDMKPLSIISQTPPSSGAASSSLMMPSLVPSGRSIFDDSLLSRLCGTSSSSSSSSLTSLPPPLFPAPSLPSQPILPELPSMPRLPSLPDLPELLVSTDEGPPGSPPRLRPHRERSYRESLDSDMDLYDLLNDTMRSSSLTSDKDESSTSRRQSVPMDEDIISLDD